MKLKSKSKSVKQLDRKKPALIANQLSSGKLPEVVKPPTRENSMTKPENIRESTKRILEKARYNVFKPRHYVKKKPKQSAKKKEGDKAESV